MLSGLACGTRSGAVVGDAASAGVRVLGSKAVSEVELLSAVSLVGRPPSELDSGDQRVVVEKVRADERLEPAEGVELVEVEPAMPELAPEGLDHRVGLDDVDLGDDVVGDGGDVSILADDEVLGAAVGHDADLRALGECLPSAGEDLPRSLCAESRLQRPRENAARVIVDDRVEVRPRPVEQADDRRVDAPPLVRSGRTDSELGLAG